MDRDRCLLGDDAGLADDNRALPGVYVAVVMGRHAGFLTAASALGRHYPGGRAAFIETMNKKAKALRMTHTHFADSTGLSSQNQASAGDLVLMAQAASQYSLIREFTTTAQRTVSFPQPRYSLDFVNTNRLVRGGSWDIQLSKTGFTNEAGRAW